MPIPQAMSFISLQPFGQLDDDVANHERHDDPRGILADDCGNLQFAVQRSTGGSPARSRKSSQASCDSSEIW